MKDGTQLEFSSRTAGIASGHGPGSQTYSLILPQASCLQYPHLPGRSDIPASVAHFFFSFLSLVHASYKIVTSPPCNWAKHSWWKSAACRRRATHLSPSPLCHWCVSRPNHHHLTRNIPSASTTFKASPECLLVRVSYCNSDYDNDRSGPVATKRKLVWPKYEQCEKKNDGKSCRESKTSRAQHGPSPAGSLGGAVSPPAGPGQSPGSFWKFHSFPSQSWLVLLTLAWKCLDCLDYFRFKTVSFLFCPKLVRPWPENRTLCYGLAGGWLSSSESTSPDFVRRKFRKLIAQLLSKVTVNCAPWTQLTLRLHPRHCDTNISPMSQSAKGKALVGRGTG